MQTNGMAVARSIALAMLLVNLGTAGSAVGSVAGRPQHGGLPLGQMPNQPPGLPPLGPETSPAQEEKQNKLRNDDRQKRLEADTQKLLDLATKLHDDVSKTNKNVLSLDVIKRADEIERLAHAVKERMRG